MKDMTGQFCTLLKPIMPMGTIDFYHVILLQVTSTLAGVAKSVQDKTSLVHFLSYFSTERDTILYGNESVKAEYPKTTRKVAAVLLTASKCLNFLHASRTL